MIKLSKLFLVFWQSYECQLIHFQDITLLTGMTGSGKSTVMDALNMILLGEKNRNIFNKAANENSDRTIESYLFGKLGDDGAEGYHYLRQGNFTSIVAAEFVESDSNKHFTAGLLADCGENLQYVPHWFIKESVLDEAFFIDPETQLPRSYSELVQHNAASLEENTLKFYSTDKEYRRMAASRFGQLRNDFRRLLKQSMTFNPVKNIAEFLTEFVSDQENKVNVTEMQNSIRYYNQLVAQTEEIKNKISGLEEIVAKSKSYAQKRFTISQQEFVIERAQLDELVEKEAQLKNEVQQNLLKLKDHGEDLAIQQREKAQREQLAAELNDQRGKLAAVAWKSIQEEKITSADHELQGIQKNTQNAQNILHQFSQNLKVMEQNTPENVSKGEQSKISPAIATIRAHGDCADLVGLNRQLFQFIENKKEQQWQINHEIQLLAGKIAKAKTEITGLEKGIKPVPEKEATFRKGLGSFLEKKFGNGKVAFLFEELEFVPGEKSWEKAIEAYLGNQKNYLVVEPKMYQAALAYYQQVQKTGEVAGIGIINLKKVNEVTYGAKEKSVAKKVQGKNPLIQNYLNYLLGRVIACDTVEELEQYPIGLTRDGFLYQRFVTKRLKLKIKYFIGSGSLQGQLNEAREELTSLKQQQTSLEKEAAGIAFIHQMRALDETTMALLETFGSGSLLNAAKTKLANLKEELAAFDDREVQEIDRKIQENQAQLSRITQRIAEINVDVTRLEERNEKLKGPLMIQAIDNLNERQKHFDSLYQHHAFKARYEAFYEQSLRSREVIDYARITENFRNNLQQNRNSLEMIQKEVQDLVTQFNYQYPVESLPIDLNQSQVYQERLTTFQDSDLPKKEGQIKEALAQAQKIFRYDFLGKIRGNIENLKRQIDEINRVLKGRKFGEDEYKFQVSPREQKKAFYKMIMDELLINQDELNLFSESFEVKYQREIEQLFAILAGSPVASLNAKETLIDEYSDYRNYLEFDILVQKGTEKQRLSKTYGSKSGGETQIPLYIALLAAFSSVYRVKEKRNNHTLRLVLMDEAFSKIDGEKIKECIDLVREFDLQAIFSTPPEKVPEIMAKADKAVVVFRDKNQVEIREFASLSELEGD